MAINGENRLVAASTLTENLHELMAVCDYAGHTERHTTQLRRYGNGFQVTVVEAIMDFSSSCIDGGDQR